MGDSQTVVAQTSNVMDHHLSVGYRDYTKVNSDASTVTTGDPVFSASAAYAIYAMHGSGSADANTYNKHPSAVTQDALVGSFYDINMTVGVNSNCETAFGQENIIDESGQAASNGSVICGAKEIGNNASSGVGENGIVSNEVGASVVEQQFTGESAITTEEDRLWSIVRANTLDFNAWQALVQETEQENNVQKIRKVYDAFLAEFPLCYGYWKKYADHEGRLGTIDNVIKVYEQAVLAVTYSVDIWLHYCEFAVSTYEDPETVRQLFERGLAYVGTDYLSYPLWDEYIKYEYSHQEWSHLAIIYTRILGSPIQHLDQYFNGFKELASSRPLSEIWTGKEAAMGAAGTEMINKGVESRVHPDVVEQSPKLVSAGLTEAEELEKYITIREEMYKKAKELDSKILGFETAIRRPYFHVKPLDDLELENWHNYLDFVERGDDFNQVIKLYERCLIPCAIYPEFWIRYVLCMEANGSTELANNALARATQVFVKKHSEIHLFAARFKEHSGDISGAQAEYQLLYSEISPGLLEALAKHANMEYRLGNKEAAFSVYEKTIAAANANKHSQALPMLLVQYSRFLYLVAGNPEKARDILSGAIDHQLSKPLLEAIIHLESVHSLPKRIDYLDSLVEKFTKPNPDNPNSATTTDRENISSIFLEFLDLFGDAESIKKANCRHSLLFLRHRNVPASRKRHAEDHLDLDQTKFAKTCSSSTQSVLGVYPNAENQWPAGYGTNPPAWPQAPHANEQQWNPGLGPQDWHGSYGGFGSYSHPQVAACVPQCTTAYGAHPTYPVQAFPEQSYNQPAAAAVYAQQQAAVPQDHYGGHY